MEYLLGIIGALLGGLFFLNTKKKSAEALNENLDVKNKANELDKEAAKNSGLIEAEEIKRKELQEKANEQANESVPDFFNNRK